MHLKKLKNVDLVAMNQLNAANYNMHMQRRATYEGSPNRFGHALNDVHAQYELMNQKDRKLL